MTSKGGVVAGTYHYTTIFATINTQTPGWTGNASIVTNFVDGSVAPTGTLTINSTSTGTMATGLTILDASNNPLGVVASGAGSTWALSSNFLSQTSQAMSGLTDDTSRIQTQIDSCPDGQVVLLGAGPFIIGSVSGNYLAVPGSTITKGIVLRGSGAGVTFLIKPNGGWPRNTTTVSGTNGILTPFGQPVGGWDQTQIIQVAPSIFPTSDPTSSQNLTADGNRGDFSITLDGSSAWTFAVGQFVLLDEASLSSWVPVPNGFGCTDNATPTPCPPFVWVCDKFASNIHWPIQLFQDDSSNSDVNAPYDTITSFTGSISGNVLTSVGSPALVAGSRLFGTGISTPTTLVSGSGNTWRVAPAQTVASTTISAYDATPSFFGYSRADRAGCEIKEIVAVNGNTITFNSPLAWPYRVSHGAQLTAYSNTYLGRNSVHVKYSGIEQLTMRGGGNGNLRFSCAAYCWARNVESTLWVNEGFARTDTFRIEIRDSYSHQASYPTPCGGGYSFSGANGDSEVLIENNIILDANKMMVFRACGAGGVVAHNYADDGWISFNTVFTEIGMNASHLGGSHHVLMEGNICFNADSDFTHGATVYSTHFRNWYTGQRRSFTDQTVRAAAASAYAWNHSFVGNVLGYQSRPSWIWSGGVPATNVANGWAITDSAMACDVNGGNCVGGGSSAAWFNNSDGWAVGYDPERFSMVPEPVTLASIIRDGNWDWVSAAQHWYTTPATFLIPNSMYLSSKPAFFNTYSDTWPIANPATGATFVNPALHRYNNGTPNAP